MPIAEEQPAQQLSTATQKRRKNAPEFLFGLWLSSLIAALIFGTQTAAIGVMVLGGLLAFLLFGHPTTARNLRAVFQHKEAISAASFLVPAMFLSGIFADKPTIIMLVTVAVFALGLLGAAIRGEALLSLDSEPLPTPEKAPQSTPPIVPLPQAASGTTPMPDLRELCRGLPAALSGEVMQTVEQLEEAAAQAKRSGDTRRSFDAEQALHDYLPQTVTAWKNQAAESRNPDELLSALAQIRTIANGSGGSEHARQEWEIQQRFLLEKSADLETAK